MKIVDSLDRDRWRNVVAKAAKDCKSLRRKIVYYIHIKTILSLVYISNVILEYLDLELDHVVLYVKKHNMACDIQLVVFPNNMVWLSYFSKYKIKYLNIHKKIKIKL